MSACLAFLIGTTVSCNKKTEESTEDTYMPSSTAAVTEFKLKSMPDSITHAGIPLDSVFFSIDLNRGVIFNADSLPMGTRVNKLIPVISYTSSASEVKLKSFNGVKDVENDYKESPNDTINFTGLVTLSIKAEDKEVTRDYVIKINVHQVNPDSLMWDQLAVTAMPSRMEHPVQQKTVKYWDSTYSMVKENDGTYTLSVAIDLLAGEWSKFPVSFDFDPDLRTLCATPLALCMLDTSGVLHTSEDGLTWENTGLVWTNIIGCYDTALLGLRSEGGRLMHTSWPASAGFAEMPVAGDFPVEGYSDFVQFSNKWTTLPIGFITGGRLADGSLTEKTWGFDGDHWEVLSQNMMPAVADAAVVPYFVYRKTSSSLVQTEFSVWMLIGGELADGSANRRVFVSYDNGVNWYAASEGMQLPSQFPGLRQLDALMVEWPKKASLEGNWTKAGQGNKVPMARVKYEVDDYEVYWDCPYIYVFGGITDTGAFNSRVWRGVLNRLTFIPQF